MPLVFSAIIPHSPVTIPEIGGDKTTDVAITLGSIKELEGELYVMQPDTLFIVSPHAPVADASFSLNLAQGFTASFQEFGEITIHHEFPCDIELISKIREYTDSHNESPPVNVISQPLLDYGSSVALHHLTAHMKSVKIVPISISLLSIQQHFAFGEILRIVATQTNKRVALIVTTELAQSITQEAPGGYHPDGQSFDQKIQSMITGQAFADILKINPELVRNAYADQAYKSLAIVFGALADTGSDSHLLSYEHPHGVGMLVSQFNLI